jgi:hypothetical protein
MKFSDKMIERKRLLETNLAKAFVSLESATGQYNDEVVDKWGDVENAIERCNTAIDDGWVDVESALDHYNGVVEEVNEFREDVVDWLKEHGASERLVLAWNDVEVPTIEFGKPEGVECPEGPDSCDDPEDFDFTDAEYPIEEKPKLVLPFQLATTVNVFALLTKVRKAGAASGWSPQLIDVCVLSLVSGSFSDLLKGLQRYFEIEVIVPEAVLPEEEKQEVAS